MFYELKVMKLEENIFLPSPNGLSTAVLVLDHSNILSFAAAVDPMRAANRRAGRQLFDWSFYSADGAPACLTSGVEITARPISALDRCDLLIVIAGFDLEQQATVAVLASLRRLAKSCKAIAGIDGGSWILARAGLLDGHTATTHWEDFEAFEDRFEQVKTVRDRYVISGKFITSGGATPCIDMMLHLIGSRFGHGLSQRVANAFIYDPVHAAEKPQGLIATAKLASKFPRVARAIALMGLHIEDPITITDIANEQSITPRHLEGQFRAALNATPKSVYLSLRLSEARRLAGDTAQSVQEIALRTGFNSQSSFARAFKSGFGHSVRVLRQNNS